MLSGFFIVFYVIIIMVVFIFKCILRIRRGDGRNIFRIMFVSIIVSF